MLNIELIEQVEQTLQKLGCASRTIDHVLEKVGCITKHSQKPINDTYQAISDKIEYLRTHIPKFIELRKESSEEDTELVKECEDEDRYSNWYNAIEHVLEQDPMSLSMPWSSTTTNRDWIGSYLRYVFDTMNRDVELVLNSITIELPTRITKIKFADDCGLPLAESCIVDMEDDAVQYRHRVQIMPEEEGYESICAGSAVDIFED